MTTRARQIASVTDLPNPDSEVVVQFLRALEQKDLDGAFALLTDDITWINVSFPTIAGRDRVEGVLRKWLAPPSAGFAVKLHHVAGDGEVVLTDRIDQLIFGRYRANFWVYGRFTVREGRIAIWRDSFDLWDVTVGMVRGLVGVFVPAANRRF